MSYTSTVYKGIPFQYKLTARGYWDLAAAKSITEDTTDTVTMTEYDGFSYTETFETETTVIGTDSDGNELTSSTVTPTGIITIPDFILPNYMPCVGRTGFVGAAGKKWLFENAVYDGIVESVRDYAVSGGVVVTGRSGYFFYDFDDNMVKIYDANSKPDNGVYVGDYNAVGGGYPIDGAYQFNFLRSTGTVTYSGTNVTYGAQSYLTANKTLPSSSYFGLNVVFLAKVTTPSNVSYSNGVAGTETVSIGIHGGKWNIYNGTETTGTSVSANTTYWVKAAQTLNGSSYTTTLSVLTDDGYTVDTLPTDGWTTAVTVDYAVFSTSDTIYLGRNLQEPTSTSTTRAGVPVDLATVRLSVGGTLYWKALGS